LLPEREDGDVRITVTLDEEVADGVRTYARRRRLSFETALDTVLRRGLAVMVFRDHRPGAFRVEAATRIRALELPVENVPDLKAESVPAPRRIRRGRTGTGDGSPPGVGAEAPKNRAGTTRPRRPRRPRGR
jgi:hypothetical protein